MKSLEDTATILAARRGSRGAVLRIWLGRLTEPQILFPLFALLVLSVIWGSTLNLIKLERAAAEQTAVASSHELLETYEAQVVRALREIDTTLKVVKYAYEIKSEGEQRALAELKERDLLPTDLLFAVSIADRDGAVAASTRAPEFTTVADQEYFLELRNVEPSNELLWVGRPKRVPSGEWTLQFARRLNTKDGEFAGAVAVAVDAAYFVSGYEPSKLGTHGTLGILGTDGVFRVRRTGETVSAGDKVDYAVMQREADATEERAEVSVLRDPWDGVRRYTSLRELYDFPLAVVVGLSEQEQLAIMLHDRRVYLWRAAIGSALLVLLIAALARLSWRLTQSREREAEAEVAHAKRIEYLAYHDALTRLPNRSLFSRLLSRSIKQARRHQKHLAVLFLDLDRFKQINDTLGHEAGDELLKEVATRLQGCLRDSDSVARLGGDEFVVLLPDLAEAGYAAIVAQKMLAALGKPFVLVGQEFRVTGSIGIGTYPQDGEDEQTLTKNADVAMYQAKAEGKNNFQFYSEKLNANSLERLTLESSLRHALERDEFQLYYQAKRDIGSGRITGMEALLRWQHPDLGTVAPMQFIPVAEETGLIVPIGKWVIKTACAQNVAWQQQGLPRLSVAVNLTARQFVDEHLLQDLASILHATGMEASLLELEITESLLIRDVAKTLRVLRGLKAMGVRIAVDDFGTGYSSLSTLKQFPLDTIKIDRSYIRDVTGAGTPEEGNLADAIVAMGRMLSLTVVAQGVETKDQVDFLRRHACDEVQGFYYNRPVAAERFTQLLSGYMETGSFPALGQATDHECDGGESSAA